MPFQQKWKNRSGTRTYFAWRSMRLRCTSQSYPGFHHYGGRGIGVCEQWANDYDQFIADMGECPDGLTLERIDNDKGYSPDNCRWATLIDQLNNQRRNRSLEHNGERRTVGQWARHLGVKLTTLMKRLERMPVADALRPGSIRPVRKHGTRSKYDAGCRCQSCKNAHNARMREARARRKARA